MTEPVNGDAHWRQNGGSMSFAEARQSGQTMPGSVSESGQLQKGQLRGQTMSQARRHQSRTAPGREEV